MKLLFGCVRYLRLSVAAVPAAVAAVAAAPSLTLLLLLLLLLLRLLIRLLSTGQRRRIFLVASGHRMTCVSFTWDPTDQQNFLEKKRQTFHSFVLPFGRGARVVVVVMPTVRTRRGNGRRLRLGSGAGATSAAFDRRRCRRRRMFLAPGRSVALRTLPLADPKNDKNCSSRPSAFT